MDITHPKSRQSDRLCRTGMSTWFWNGKTSWKHLQVSVEALFPQSMIMLSMILGT